MTLSRTIPCVALLASALLQGCAATPSPEHWTVDGAAFEVRHFYTRAAEQQVFALSPDGRYLAALEAQGEIINIVVTDLDTGQRHQTTDFAAYGATGVGWGGPDRLLLYTTNDLELMSIDIDGANPVVLSVPSLHCLKACNFGFGRTYAMTYVQAIHPLPDDPEHILVARNGLGKRAFDTEIYRLNLESGHVDWVLSGPEQPFIDRWFTDADGVIIGAEQDFSKQRNILLRDQETGEWRTVFSGPADGLEFNPYPVTGTSSGHVLTNIGPGGERRSFTGLYRFDFANGTLGELLLGEVGMDCCEVVASQRDGALVAVNFQRQGQPETRYFDPWVATAAERVGATALPGAALRVISLDRDVNRAVFLSVDTAGLPDWYLVERGAHDVVHLDSGAGAVDLIAAYRGDWSGSLVVRGRVVGGGVDMPKTQLPSGSMSGSQGQAIIDRGSAMRAVSRGR